MNKRYIELLIKYHNNTEILELLDLVRLDSARESEEYYLANKKYPDTRELLGKLKADLGTVSYMVHNK